MFGTVYIVTPHDDGSAVFDCHESFFTDYPEIRVMPILAAPI